MEHGRYFEITHGFLFALWMMNIGSTCDGGTIFTIERLVLEIFSSEGNRGKASGGRRQVMMVISSKNFFLHNIK